MSYAYLNDSSFLKEIDKMRCKEQYVKITVLDFSERPLEEIQGKVISGSLNVDGTSSVRRTCNLTMLADEKENDLTQVNKLISINKKMKLEIGFTNTTSQYKNYKIIWFPLGVYVIINASTSRSASGVEISLQLKDKMCLLNGECGGTFPASVTFNEYDTQDETGTWIVENPTIYEIIQELVNHWGGEQLGKIIISDVDTRVKKVMKWTGSSPLYILKYIDEDDGTTQYEPTTDENKVADSKYLEDYDVYSYGDDVGYIYTDFIYPSDLVGDAGSNVCAILDTIKNTLGNYEYYYDLEGNFVFQEKKNYLNTSQSTVDLKKMEQGDYVLDMSKGKSVYTFEGGELVTAYSNSPQYSMIKNDFLVWGTRKDDNDTTYPIRFHLAIDSKPKPGNTYKCFFYVDEDDNIKKAKLPRMFGSVSDFPEVGNMGIFYGVQAGEDIQIYKWNGKGYEAVATGLKDITTTDWRTELYLQGLQAEVNGTDTGYYYTELLTEWPKLYDVENGEFYEDTLNFPSDLDYYLDFIDSGAAVSELSIANIGRRTKVINDDSVNCIFESDIPDVVLIKSGAEDTETLRTECENKGQDYLQLDENIYSLLAGGGSLNSAYEMIKEMLYQYTSYNESISITALPIYYLEPNTRITVRDSQSGIYGDYLINSISLPLDTSGTMSLSCAKALERI